VTQCGPRAYELQFTDSSLADMLYLDASTKTLRFEPTQEDQVGDYEACLRVTLATFGTVPELISCF